MKPLLATFFCAVCITLFGCASTKVQIPTVRPAEMDLSGLSRVAVPEFQGPAPYAAVARNIVATELAGRQRCDVPDVHTTRAMIPACIPYQGQGVNVHQMVAQARAAGFDALVVGEVRFEGSTDDKKLVFGNPTLKATIKTQLIDLHTGHVRGNTELARQWQGKLSTSPKSDKSEQAVSTMVVRGAALATVARLASSQPNVDVSLAEAEAGDDQQAMDAGLEAARRGDWNAASDWFYRATTTRPNSYAAFYNLGVAREAVFDFAGARHWYNTALAQREQSDCRIALARVDRSWHGHHLAQQQMHHLAQQQMHHLAQQQAQPRQTQQR